MGIPKASWKSKCAMPLNTIVTSSSCFWFAVAAKHLFDCFRTCCLRCNILESSIGSRAYHLLADAKRWNDAPCVSFSLTHSWARSWAFYYSSQLPITPWYRDSGESRSCCHLWQSKCCHFPVWSELILYCQRLFIFLFLWQRIQLCIQKTNLDFFLKSALTAHWKRSCNAY